MGQTNLLEHMLRSPRTTGSLMPSSEKLAAAMAHASAGAGSAIELGGGTGAVTRALQGSYADEQLTVVELQPKLAAALANTFPRVRVIQAPAAQVLEQINMQNKVALVSSLPFRSLPKAVRQETIDSIARFLMRHPGSRLVQFTYLTGVPFAAPEGFYWSQIRTVWRNLPPARIWALRGHPEPGN
jgi:phosphatidylethanolamine/phosphatidyl-N-methylethanolamine N-methyltransferase